MPTTHRCSRLASSLPAACILLLAAGAPASRASLLSWNNALGGPAATGSNWSPSQVPVAGDILNYNLSATYAVTFNATVASVAQQNFNAGTVSLSATSPHIDTSQLVIGLAASSNATVNITGGQFTSGGILAIGSGASSTGTLNISDPTADVIVTGAPGAVVGSSATGNLNVTNGGSLQANNGVTVGRFAGSLGSVLVSGVNGVNRSTLSTTDASAGDLTIALGGAGSMTVTDGGLVQVADDFFLAPTAGLTGSTTVSTGLSACNLTVTGDAHIAHNAAAGTAAGTGTLTINTNGLVNVAGDMFIGDPDGGTGTLRVDADFLPSGHNLTVNNLTIDPAHGVFDFRDGSVVVNGAFTPASPNLVVNGSTPTKLPELTLHGPVTLSSLTVGTANQAVVNLGSGAAATVNGPIVVGSGPTGNGNLEVLSTLPFTFPGQAMTVGSQGTGLVNVAVGADMLGGSVVIAEQSGSTGTLQVSGAGSTVSLTGGITMGAAGNVGTPTLRVQNGASLTAAAAINASSNASLIDMQGGTLTAPQINLLGTAQITGTGRIDAFINAGTQPSTVITASGPLDIGPDTGNAFSFAGNLNIGANTVTIRSTALSRLGDVSIAGGSLEGPALNALANGDSLSGFGTINARLKPDAGSSITATGSGLVFNNSVTVSPSTFAYTISGTRVTLGATGSFAGAGQINAEVFSDAGSTITATGNLQLGNPASASGVNLSGTLNCGASTVTLLDLDFTPLGTVTLAGGAMSSVRPLSMGSGAGLAGHGTVTAPNLTVPGFVRPGSGPAAGSGLGTLALNGGLTLTAFTTVDLEIGGTAPGAFDQVTCTGLMNTNGALNATLLPGYTPVIGDFVTAFQAGSFIGNFLTVNLPTGWHIRSGSTTRIISFCPGDCDQNGQTTPADVACFVNKWFSSLQQGTLLGDFDGNGAVAPADVAAFVNAWFLSVQAEC